MKLNHVTLLDGSRLKDFGRRKKEQAQIRIDAAIKAALDELEHHPGAPQAFRTLVECVRTRSGLLKPTPGGHLPSWNAPIFLIRRLKNLATRHRHWIRPCETWQARGDNLRPVFRSLAHHLLTYYPVPGFMDSAWDLEDGPEAFRQQSHFIRVGRGASFRELNLPVALTRRMEHYVRLAPDHYSFAQALRYGETRGFGGGEKLAREIAGGRLGQRIERPEFWRTVLVFFVAHPEMNLAHVNPIVDFIHANKFVGDEVFTNEGAETRQAPWPEFSIKGRTLKSMLRLVVRWHADLGTSKPGEWFSWKRSAIQGYRFLEKRPEEESPREWTICELLDSGSLRAEGRDMHHCVYTYADRCRCGKTTIWSLRLRVNGQAKRLVTIEVDPRKRAIIQARTKCNYQPGDRSKEIIRRWAALAGLEIDTPMMA